MQIIRNSKIDFLRALALIGIFIAHSGPSNMFFQLRNFDVVLMVILLGYTLSFNKSDNYIKYIKKRFFKLILSTWVFTFIFFGIFFIVSLIKEDEYYFEFNQILGSFLIFNNMNTIGYIWIMRVFFLIAILSPFLNFINKKIKSEYIFTSLVILIYLIYLILLDLKFKVRIIDLVFENVIIYGIIYSLIALYGIRISLINNKKIYFHWVVFLIIFISSMYYYKFDSIQLYKYPPTIYYVSYGIFISLTLYLLFDIKIFENLLRNKFIEFVSFNSIWIYFWHIIFCYVIILFYKENIKPFDVFYARFIFITCGAILITFLQVQILNKFKKNIHD